MPSPFKDQTCVKCGAPFRARCVQPHCSKRCARTIPLDERFWAKVDKTSTCWVWTGARHKDGYGQLGVGGKSLLAHRVSWMLHHGGHHGGFPSHEVCHSCDNPPCVRPDHLFLGSHRENMDDAARKGRIGAGLDYQAAREIRALAGQMSQQKLAELYGVGQTQISRIIRGLQWPANS